MARQLILTILLASMFVMASTTFTAEALLNARSSDHADPALKDHFQSIAKSISDKIKHVIVVMMENRSFDHMFGFYGKGTNGLTGKEYNLAQITNPDSHRVYVDSKAPFRNECDPHHSYPTTMAKLYGNKSHAQACGFKCENMGGFVHSEHVRKTKNYCNVMESFNNTRDIPIMTTLADNFVLMDRFFCSVPGPTWPNRLFHLSGTSMGLTETLHYYEDVNKKLFPQKTIFDQVKQAGGEWKLYYNDTPWEMFLESVAHNPEHLHSMDQFFKDAADGTLPDFAFINPLLGSDKDLGGNNDHHPDHDIRLGEWFYKDVYEALRAGPKWNETLYIVTYDEHGGFHDHVHPPTNVPPPAKNITSYPDAGFEFDRIGVRIPTLLISPWVPKGHVLGRAPKAQRPTETSEYDLTSIMASTRKILKKLHHTPPLTGRDAWSSTFEHVFDLLDAPRTDCPMHLPTPGKPLPAETAAEGRLPINDLQADVISMHHFLAEPDATEPYPSHIRQQSEVGAFAQASFEKHRARTLRWKAGKGHSSKAVAEAIARHGVPAAEARPLRMVAAAHELAPLAVARNETVSHVTIHNTNGMCFDIAEAVAGTAVAVNHCYPTANPTKNRDVLQWWVVNDRTVRPHAAQHLCLTAEKDGAVVVDDCTNAENQQFAVDGSSNGIALASGVAAIAH